MKLTPEDMLVLVATSNGMHDIKDTSHLITVVIIIKKQNNLFKFTNYFLKALDTLVIVKDQSLLSVSQHIL